MSMNATESNSRTSRRLVYLAPGNHPRREQIIWTFLLWVTKRRAAEGRSQGRRLVGMAIENNNAAGRTRNQSNCNAVTSRVQGVANGSGVRPMESDEKA